MTNLVNTSESNHFQPENAQIKITQEELDNILEKHARRFYSSQVGYSCEGETANLCDLDVRGLSFVNANLVMASMKFVNAEGCDFRGADLSNCFMQHGNFKNCDFRVANGENAYIAKASFDNAKGADNFYIADE